MVWFCCGVLEWRGEAGWAPSLEEFSRQSGKLAGPRIEIISCKCIICTAINVDIDK